MKRATGSLWTSLIGAAVIAVAGMGLVFAVSTTVRADLLDPLHGYCGGAGQCVDNGTNSPTTMNPPVNFGFNISPGPQTGDFLMDFLVPNNEAQPINIAVTGTLVGTATKFSPTAWTTGSLAPYLGISASPDNPIGAFLPSTVALDPGATGFFVYQVDFGTQTLAANPSITGMTENLISSLDKGSYIVGFLNAGTTSPDWRATANSGAIFETHDAVPGPTAGAGLPGLALASIGLFIGWRRRRRADA